MSRGGFHLTRIGDEECLFEPGSSLDIGEADALIESILGRLQASCARALYYDLSELALIDPVYFAWLNRLARACATQNVRMVCVGMQPTAAFALTRYSTDPPVFETALDVRAPSVRQRT